MASPTDGGSDASGAAAPAPEMPELVRVFECSNELISAAAHDVVILVWRAGVSSSIVRRIERVLTRVRAEHPQFYLLSVLRPTALSPSDAFEREAVSRLTAALEACAGVAVLLEGSAKEHVSLRLEVATINLVESQGVTKVVFDTVEEASAWICKRTTKLEAHELASAVTALRAQPPR